jgi:hypothetical protein
VLRVFRRTAFGWQRRQAARRGLVGVRSGVSTRPGSTARPGFHRRPPPSDEDIAAPLAGVARRVRRLLLRRGRWPYAEAGRDPVAAQEPLCASAVAASLPGGIAPPSTLKPLPSRAW